MRIAHIVEGFPAIYETFILRQMTGMVDRGHEIDIYSLHRTKSKIVHAAVGKYSLLDKAYYLDEGLPSAPARRVLGGLFKTVGYSFRYPATTWSALSPLLKYRAHLVPAPYFLGNVLDWRKRRYDVVHCQYGHLGLLMGYAGDIWRAKLVVSFRGHDFANLPKIYGANMYRSIFRRADAITTTSEFGRQQIIKLGCDPSKVFRVYSPTPTSDFAFRERGLAHSGPITLISVGRLIPNKGQEWVIRAMADVTKTHPGVVYEIVGDGPDRVRLETLVAELGLTRTVRFTGAVTSLQVADALNKADIFIMPSIQEALGNAAVEALASGLPIIASNVGGLPEVVIDGVTGFLVPPGDAGAIAQKVLDLLERPETWPAMGRAGRFHAEANFDITSHMDRILEVYESVCHRPTSERIQRQP